MCTCFHAAHSSKIHSQTQTSIRTLHCARPYKHSHMLYTTHMHTNRFECISISIYAHAYLRTYLMTESHSKCAYILLMHSTCRSGEVFTTLKPLRPQAAFVRWASFPFQEFRTRALPLVSKILCIILLPPSLQWIHMDKEKKSFRNTNTHKLHVWFHASSCACSLLHTHKQVLSEAPDHPVLGVAVVGYRWKFSNVSSLLNWQYKLAVELTFENSYQSFLESLRYEYLQQSWLPRALDRWLYMYICTRRECALHIWLT